MKSSALIRTNVGLTTNVKVVVGSNYSLFLDSIVSTPELSDNRYKKFQFDKDSYLDDLLPVFFQKTPAEIAYKIKYDDDVDRMSTDFVNQYDDLYQFGARNITDNKFYSEEYEYFAPLYIQKNNLPKNFIIFRIDGPGLINLNKDNFKQEILQKMKFVKNFDLTPKSYLGQWISKNITGNNFYPNNSLYIDFRRLEFSTWGGIDYERGGYIQKNVILDSVLENELPYYEMEKLILESYQNNKIIFPNIINFSFLFDDTPSTPDSVRKWSLNRYLGFYIDDLTLVTSVSPNQLPKLREDVIIDDKNVLMSSLYETPFENEWEQNDYPYVEIDGVYYKIEKFQQITSLAIRRVQNTSNSYEEKLSSLNVTKFKVISDISLDGKKFSDMNRKLIKITEDKFIQFQDGTDFTIDNFDSADVWLIGIGDIFHNLILQNNKIKINTDWGFSQSSERFSYYTNGINSESSRSINLVTTKDNPPVEFKIYKCKFTDIKDFDTQIVDTSHSKFEYELEDSLTNSDEPKMYMVDLSSTTNPKDNVQFKLQNQVVTIPASSEYTANSELFRIQNDTLTPLWRKNTQRLKWGFVGSISGCDYPYLLNNSLLSEDYNKSPNNKDVVLKREKRNLDHFYTLNSDSSSYLHHSLHVEDHVGPELNVDFKFELEKYLGVNYDQDYFSYFFGKKTRFLESKLVKKTQKFSYFQNGNVSTPNLTLFRGLKFKIQEIDNINFLDNKIQKINVKNTNKFDSWKFSILVSTNDFMVTSSGIDGTEPNIIGFKNALKWRIIDNWKHEKDYGANSMVIYDETLYRNTKNSRILNPNDNPKISDEWVVYEKPTIFYSPDFDGSEEKNNFQSVDPKLPPLVYNYGQYFYSDGENSYDFWDSESIYSVDDIVTYKNKNWVSLQNDNKTIPHEDSGFFTASIFIKTWEETNLDTRWRPVEIWNSDSEYLESSWNERIYGSGNYVIYDDVVYGATTSTQFGVPPTLDMNWKRIYSLIPDTNFFYGNSIKENNIISLNGKFYECVQSSFLDVVPDNTLINYSLDNGIYVIINEKHKNILVNIYINDNTYCDTVQITSTIWDINKNNIQNTKRDDIYTTIYSKLSTNNLMNCLNDLSNKFGFSDFVKYIVVAQTQTKIYDFGNLKSVTELPYLLNCEGPDEFLIKNRSNIYEPVSLKPSEIKSKKFLNDSNIDDLSKLNFYNEMSLASKITKNTEVIYLLPNYSGLQNQIFYKMYRFSGFYGPILRDIDLFDSPTLMNSDTNYKFDTELSDFGMIKEKIVSKVNRRNNLLRFSNVGNLKSIYPMIDEYGYHTIDFFMFKSTWDLNYHFETQEYELELDSKQIKSTQLNIQSKDFKNNNSKLL